MKEVYNLMIGPIFTETIESFEIKNCDYPKTKKELKAVL